MLLQRLSTYVTEPMYRNDCYVNDEYTVLNYGLSESQKRILDVLSLGSSRTIQVYTEYFPWQEFEELLGEHLNYAIRASIKKTNLAAARGEICPITIFEMYVQKYRAFSFA